MEAKLLEVDLFAALNNTCTDSAPEPNGIPYNIYKKLWRIAVLHKHSRNTGVWQHHTVIQYQQASASKKE
jgi:hypothetical protein